MTFVKTFRAWVISPTKWKRDLLDSEYSKYQWWMIFGRDEGLLSCFKAHKGFKQKRVTYREYPLPLWSRLIKDWFRKRDTQLTPYWIKIPNSERKGRGLWLPLKFSQALPAKFTLKDSFLVRKEDQYYLHLTLEVDAPLPYRPRTIQGLDLGITHPVTSVNLTTKETRFWGKDLKRVRGKYYYLRKTLGQHKNLKQIRKIKQREKNTINTLLHGLAKSLVLTAHTNQSGIIIGRLTHLKAEKGKRVNRKLSTFAHYKLRQYLRYKAKEHGVPFLEVNEAYTSRTCSGRRWRVSC